MRKLILAFVAASAVLSTSAMASVDLATKSKCMTCHQVEKKVLGPAFKDVAAKYKSQKAADQMLVSSILKGSKNKWGKIPMPAQKVSAADAQTLAKWVLTLK